MWNERECYEHLRLIQRFLPGSVPTFELIKCSRCVILDTCVLQITEKNRTTNKRSSERPMESIQEGRPHSLRFNARQRQTVCRRDKFCLSTKGTRGRGLRACFTCGLQYFQNDSNGSISGAWGKLVAGPSWIHHVALLYYNRPINLLLVTHMDTLILDCKQVPFCRASNVKGLWGANTRDPKDQTHFLQQIPQRTFDNSVGLPSIEKVFCALGLRVSECSNQLNKPFTAAKSISGNVALSASPRLYRYFFNKDLKFGWG